MYFLFAFHKITRLSQLYTLREHWQNKAAVDLNVLPYVERKCLRQTNIIPSKIVDTHPIFYIGCFSTLRKSLLIKFTSHQTTSLNLKHYWRRSKMRKLRGWNNWRTVLNSSQGKRIAPKPQAAATAVFWRQWRLFLIEIIKEGSIGTTPLPELPTANKCPQWHRHNVIPFSVISCIIIQVVKRGRCLTFPRNGIVVISCLRGISGDLDQATNYTLLVNDFPKLGSWLSE